MGFFKNKIGNEIKNKLKSKRVINFIERVCIDFELELERTERELGENPLCYREKTMSSFLFPALQNNSIRTLMEISYKNNERDNFLDFYSLDKTRECCYLIEFKHRFWGSNQKKFHKMDIERWNNVNEQIAKLDKETVENHIDSNKDIYGISFFMLTVCTKKENMNDEIEKIIKGNIENDMNDYHWGWICELPKTLNYENHDLDDEPDDESIKYSHVIFLGRVTDIDK